MEKLKSKPEPSEQHINGMLHLKIYDKKEVQSLTTIRRFETKLGERIQILSDAGNISQSLKESNARFVLVGVPEELGTKANYGMGGTDSLWNPFLQHFLNLQSNDFLDGNEILLAGHFDFRDIQSLIDTTARSEEEKIEAYRHAVNTVDDEVEQLIKIITEHKKIPMVVGGGHNNAYPLLKGAAKGWYKNGTIPIAQITSINLDAHADYRPMEGRHSGNAFRYAEEDGYLQKYFIIGLQENYLPQNVWSDMVNNPFIDCITFEDIFVHEKRNFLQAVAHAAGFTDDNLCGIELDMDSIEYTLSSATTPVGITPVQARQFVSFLAVNTKPAYLHICEGASRLTNGKTDENTSKLISYLISDFVKGFSLE
jgi:formiminoglutamase